MSATPWWKHAVIYQVDPRGFSSIGGITRRLDYIQSLGIDALLLTPLQPDSTHAETIDPTLGSLDDMDDLIHQASRLGIRVLLELDPGTPDLTSVARFWLNRGIAGFHVVSPPAGESASTLAELRKLTVAFVGQRILISDLTPADPQPKPTTARDREAVQLILDPRPGNPAQLSAATIRTGMNASQDILQSTRGMPVLLTDGPTYSRSMTRYADGAHDLAIAKVLASILLTTRSAALIYYGQELGLPGSSNSAPAIEWDAPPASPKGQPVPPPDPSHPDVALEDADPQSLLNWYRQLSRLRHGNGAISSGVNITLNHDNQNILAWVRKPQTISTVSPAIVVICNLSAQAVQLSLKEDMQRLHLKGSFLRTILRSDSASGPVHLDGMTIPPYGVYIGELRF